MHRVYHGKSRAANRRTIGSRGISRWSSCAPDRISAWVMDAHQSFYPALLPSFSPSVSRGRWDRRGSSCPPFLPQATLRVKVDDNGLQRKRPSLLSLFHPEGHVIAVYWPTSEIVSTTCVSLVFHLSFFHLPLIASFLFIRSFFRGIAIFTALSFVNVIYVSRVFYLLNLGASRRDANCRDFANRFALLRHFYSYEL